MKIPDTGEIRKPSKTLAGVTPIAVMVKPKKCKHGTCLYCPSLNVPQSYTPKSPPVLRAFRHNYDPYLQVESRLKAFTMMNHPTDKIELIVMGGNFLDYPSSYQDEFIKGIYDALNGKKSKSLESAKKLNETAIHRCVALCIESRPDTILKKGIIERLLNYGCTRVEIGVQCLDDEIYKFVNRGHRVKEVVLATKLLRDNGFKVGYHMMLGLPKSNPKKDYSMFKRLFNDDNFKPDQLKIYPCQVIQGAGLEELYKSGKYKPYTQKQIEKLLEKIMLIIPNYCRIMRIMREIPPEYLTAGVIRIDLRRDFDSALKSSKLSKRINEIRFREIGFCLRDLKKGEKINTKIELKTTKYTAGSGDEYFLEFVNKDNILFGLLRLRVMGDNSYNCPPATPTTYPRLKKVNINNKELNNKFAIIRELHVYGQSLSIGEKGTGFGQHLGLGKMLMKEAEKIAKENSVKVLKVISGVGVREYYKKLGYKIDKNGVYMEKML
jgi:elongator complex protein 3